MGPSLSLIRRGLRPNRRRRGQAEKGTRQRLGTKGEGLLAYKGLHYANEGCNPILCSGAL